MVFVVAEECDVFQDEGVVGLGIDHALAASGIEANGFVVGDAVAEGLDLLQFLEDGLLSETRLAGGEYLQERLTTETEGNLGEHVCPEAETDGGDHLVGRVLPLGDHRGDVVQRVALMWRVFQHPAALQLVVNPVGIVEVGRVMAVDGVAEHDFKDVEYTVELLAQLDVVTVERQGFIGVAAARILVFVESSSRKSILEIFIFHKFFAICLHNSDILLTFAT